MIGAFLPDAHSATVADPKVRDYLLDPTHPGNNGKAAFFLAFGFDRSVWGALRAALQEHPRINPIERVQPNPYGTRYRVRCSITTPDGRNPCITTVWVIDTPGGVPQLVTAFP